MPSKAFSPNLTSYDLLKSLALLLMVLDHVGYFFFPDNEWFRVVGRASMPIWLFLIGYARTRDITPSLKIGAGLLIASCFIFGDQILPLNILVTIIIVRLVIDKVAAITFKNWEVAMYSTFLLSVLGLGTYFLFEYGTLALLIALSGYLARHGAEINLSDRAKKIFMGFSVGIYALSQLLIFHMPKVEAQAMVVCIGLAAILLYYFQPREVPEVEEKLPWFVTSALQFGGRYTLEIYVVHLILFRFICCFYHLKQYGWFAWQWIR